MPCVHSFLVAPALERIPPFASDRMHKNTAQQRCSSPDFPEGNNLSDPRTIKSGAFVRACVWTCRLRYTNRTWLVRPSTSVTVFRISCGCVSHTPEKKPIADCSQIKNTLIPIHVFTHKYPGSFHLHVPHFFNYCYWEMLDEAWRLLLILPTLEIFAGTGGRGKTFLD